MTTPKEGTERTLKPCPFCGEKPDFVVDEMRCIRHGGWGRFHIPADHWNTRPLEDSLSKALSDARGEVERGKEVVKRLHHLYRNWEFNGNEACKAIIRDILGQYEAALSPEQENQS